MRLHNSCHCHIRGFHSSLNWSKMVSKLKYVLEKLHLNCLFSQFSSWGSRASTGVKTRIINCCNSVLIICNSMYCTVLLCNTVVLSILDLHCHLVLPPLPSHSLQPLPPQPPAWSSKPLAPTTASSASYE